MDKKVRRIGRVKAMFAPSALKGANGELIDEVVADVECRCVETFGRQFTELLTAGSLDDLTMAALCGLASIAHDAEDA